MPRNRTPLREQAFRFVPLIVGAIVGLLVVFVLFPPLFRQIHLPVVILVVAVAVFLVVIFGAGVVGLIIGRRIVGDHIEIAMRVPGERWQHGRLTVGPGHFAFQTYALQLRIPSGNPVDFTVTELGPDVGRRPEFRQIWRLNPQLQIVEVRTDRGLREIGALPSAITELRERLMESDPPVTQVQSG